MSTHKTINDHMLFPDASTPHLRTASALTEQSSNRITLFVEPAGHIWNFRIWYEEDFTKIRGVSWERRRGRGIITMAATKLEVGDLS